MVDSVLLVFTVVGIFSVIDSLADEPTRAKMSDYIFGTHGLTARHYEAAVMKIWLVLFIRDGRVNFPRIILLSLFISLSFALVNVAVTGPDAIFSDLGVWGGVASILGMAIIGIPIEYLNIQVTKIVYTGKLSRLNISAKFMLDFLFSLSVATAFIVNLFIVIRAFPVHFESLGDSHGRHFLIPC
jgi:hypothetical protein